MPRKLLFLVCVLRFINCMLYVRLSNGKCAERCEESKMNLQKARIMDRAMNAVHIFKTLTVAKVYDCHVKCFEERCLCQAFQMMQNRCELLYETRFSAPDDFEHKDGCVYFDINREYVQQAHCLQSCRDNVNCCEPGPCLNGGTCTESCASARKKFYCACPQEFVGRLCQRKQPRSCKDYFWFSGGHKRSGVYQLPVNRPLTVYCDFDSEKGFVWTLIESFAFMNNAMFREKPFFYTVPVNQKAFKWQKYRLSYVNMKEIADHSTHARATCNFDTERLKYVDYLRVKLSEINIMNFRVGKFVACKTFEYINIRGFDCMNCTCHFSQDDTMHAHVDSYKSESRCQLKSHGSIAFEDDFGRYEHANPAHRCVSSANSTTQWWLGERL